VAETGSTNADALALARDGAPEGVVFVADHQTAGRGRLGRTWQAPPGSSLLVTVLLRPPEDQAELVTFAAAVSMAEAVEATTGVRALLKWPNDLTVEDRKLAGVLAEADWHDDGVVVCVGIGVNCNWPDDVPSELREALVALNHLTGVEVDRRALLDVFLGALDTRYPKLDRAGLLLAWRARSATLGRAVRVDLGTEVVEGTAADVTVEGHLVVETTAGPRTFAAGDVTHLRHA
jgi:BirA family biotin operon repressor/biotin-[acetyl-CoA-carboxylase] ligase